MTALVILFFGLPCGSDGVPQGIPVNHIPLGRRVVVAVGLGDF
jgi:hypothetical protein